MRNWWHEKGHVMDYFKMISFAKLFCVAVGGSQNISITSDEMEMACETLKHMADQRYDWNQEQKELYKILVDFTKERTKGRE